MGLEIQQFGKTKSGEQVHKYILTNNNGIAVSVIDYGAIITNIITPDKEGKTDDIVLGFDTISQYEENGNCYGSFIGRNANRIGKASCNINGELYKLEKNDGKNNLHSGNKGYNKFMYKANVLSSEIPSIEFTRTSPDMEQGFPGTINLSVIYTLSEENELILTYHAVSDKDTIINLTNHSYFNLAGHASGTVLHHKVSVLADNFTPSDEEFIPTGEIREVAGTPMDLRLLKPLGVDINADYLQLKQAGGYDHNYIIRDKNNSLQEDGIAAESDQPVKEEDRVAKEAGKIVKAAELLEDNSGRRMEVFTTEPCMQLYTGNFINGKEAGKEGFVYEKHGGVCFETQKYPNSCNIPSFPSSIVSAGEEYYSKTIYKFSVIN